MLCEFCSDMPFDELTIQQFTTPGYKYHSNWATLCQSADRGCKVCRFVRDMKDRFCPPNYRIEDGQLICRLDGKAGLLSWFQGDDSLIVSCRVYVESGDPMAPIIQTRPVSQDLLSESGMQVVKDWLKQCNSHPECPKAIDYPLPTRVIDVGTPTAPPRLIESNGGTGQWVALSHCWGGLLPLKTESTNIDAHRRELPVMNFPATFRDAVELTRNLGIRYLWIDALCIIQDVFDDWNTEASKMGDIYKYALLTIAAEAALNSAAGIRASVNAHQLYNEVPKITAKCHSREHNLSGKITIWQNISSPPEEGPLSTRAWTLQEEILSPRLLRLSQNQLLWRCNTARWKEWLPGVQMKWYETANRISDSYLKILQPEHKTKSRIKMRVLNYWHIYIVSNYAKRKITYPTDRLLAIAALAKAIQPYMPYSKYYAGLWIDDSHEDDTLEGLLWAPINYGAVRTAEYIAPSWSWASIDWTNVRTEIGQSCMFSYPSELIPLAKVLDVTLKNVNDDPYGQVESGTLTINGPCQDVCSCRVLESFFDERTMSRSGKYNVSSPFNIAYLPPDERDRLLEEVRADKVGKEECRKETGVKHGMLRFLKIAVWRREQKVSGEKDISMALILEATGAHYRRVGRAVLAEVLENRETWPTCMVIVI